MTLFFLIGAAAAPLAWLLIASAFEQETFARQNYRARVLPTAAGLVLPLVVLAVTAVTLLARAGGADLDDVVLTALWVTVALSLGFALLGMFDDLGGTGQSGGFGGHLRSLLTGQLTTGSVKLFGGAALAVVAAYLVSPRLPEHTGPGELTRLLADAALIALAANLANLFDRAPGRVLKISLVAFAGLVAAVGAVPGLAGTALVVGAGLGLIWADLREHLMLGDTGANVVGAALGLGVLLTCSPGVRNGVLVALLALNLISERVSFSRVISAVPPLRYVDLLGRQR